MPEGGRGGKRGGFTGSCRARGSGPERGAARKLIAIGLALIATSTVANATGLLLLATGAVAPATGLLLLATGVVAAAAGLLLLAISAVAPATGLLLLATSAVARATGLLLLATSAVALATSAVVSATGLLLLATGAVALATRAVALATGLLLLATGAVALATGLLLLATGAVALATSAVALATSAVALATSAVALATSAVALATSAVALATSAVALPMRRNQSASRRVAAFACEARFTASSATHRTGGPRLARQPRESTNPPKSFQKFFVEIVLVCPSQERLPDRTRRRFPAMKVIPVAKVKLPFDPVEKPKELATTVIEQVTGIQQAPDYPNQPAVQTAATATLAAAQLVVGTDTALDNNALQRVNLESTQATQVSALKLAHDSLRTAMNTASKGNATAAKAWTGKIQSRTVTDASTAAPTDPTATATKTGGMVRGKCKAEKGVTCYLFQHGPTPTAPDSWPPPVISSKCTWDLPGQPLGSLVYMRIAVVRKNGGQGAWSNVLEVTVK